MARFSLLICFVALVIQRVMRERLRQSPIESVVSPERALSILRQIQTHRVNLANGEVAVGLSTINDQQLAIMKGLKVPKPRKTAQYVEL